MNKKVIGIIAKHRSDGVRPDLAIRDEVKQAIFDNGGIAIGIIYPNDDISHDLNINHNIDNFDLIINQLNLCDGIIFQGGNLTDHFELEIAKYCYINNIPTLGICAGQSVVAKAAGATIKEVSNKDKHYNVVDDYVHDVFVHKSSRFYSVVGSEILKVNSRHHYTIDSPGSLLVSAISDDGNIEVVEDEAKRYYVGIRFHPESLYKKDSKMNNIFVDFLNKCKD